MLNKNDARMMQEYISIDGIASQAPASTIIHISGQEAVADCLPGRQVVKNIINFARCYQMIHVDNHQVKVYLN